MSEAPVREHRIVAGLLRRQGMVLLCHRSPQRRWYPDSWDLPGGHVEVDEQPGSALIRELREELGIEIPTQPVESQAHVQGSDFRMDIWLIDFWIGEPSNEDQREHDMLAWVDVDRARELHLAHPRLMTLIESVLS